MAEDAEAALGSDGGAVVPPAETLESAEALADVPMEVLPTSADVLAMAAYLGIDLRMKREFHLLSVAREAVTAPVKYPFVELEDDDGKPYFYNHKTRGSTRRHPLDQKFLDLIRHLRQTGTAVSDNAPESPALGDEPAGPLAPERTWMRFERQDGQECWHDFDSGADAGSAPPGADILALAPELMPQYEDDLVALALQTAASREVDAVRATRTFTFKSWWYEGAEEPDATSNGEVAGGVVVRRSLTVLFYLDTGLFELQLENERSVGLQGLASLTARKGEPVECWDLHVGAKLNMLGKPTTLLWADAATMRWGDFHAHRLRRIKIALEAQLRKYTTRPLTRAITFEKGAPFSGGASLRALIEQVRQLRDTLAKYRPRLAQLLAADGVLFRA